MLNSIYIFLMDLAGTECFQSIVLTWNEVGHGHQELLQHGLSSHLLPRQLQEKMSLLSEHVWDLLRNLFKDLLKLSLVLHEKKLKLSAIMA